MNIQLTARHFKASPELQQQLQEDMDRLERFFERITSCHVILDAEHKSRLTAEITLGTRGRTLVSKGTAEAMQKAIDIALSRTERQLKKYNEKKHDHRQKAEVPVEAEPVDEDDDYDV